MDISEAICIFNQFKVLATLINDTFKDISTEERYTSLYEYHGHLKNITKLLTQELTNCIKPDKKYNFGDILLIMSLSRITSLFYKILSLIKPNDIYIKSLVKFLVSLSSDIFDIDCKITQFLSSLRINCLESSKTDVHDSSHIGCSCDNNQYNYHKDTFLKQYPYLGKWKHVEYNFNKIVPANMENYLNDIIDTVPLYDIPLNIFDKELYNARANYICMEFKRSCSTHCQRIQHNSNNISYLTKEGTKIINQYNDDQCTREFINLFQLATDITLLTKNYTMIFKKEIIHPYTTELLNETTNIKNPTTQQNTNEPTNKKKYNKHEIKNKKKQLAKEKRQDKKDNKTNNNKYIKKDNKTDIKNNKSKAKK